MSQLNESVRWLHLIKEPPCKHCGHFNPKMIYGENKIRLCDIEHIQNTFDCYTPRIAEVKKEDGIT